MNEPVERTRTLDQTSTPNATYTTYAGPGCTSTATPFPGSRIGVYKSMTDKVVPNFKVRSNKGEVFNNSMSRSKHIFSGNSGGGWGHYYPPFICSTQSGVWKGISTNYLCQRLGPLGITPPAPTISESSLITAAATSALANVKSPSVQGLAFVGEIQQTINLLKNPISALTTYVQTFRGKKSRQVSGGGVAGAASSQYLAYVFGMLPLMHDIEGLLEALVKAASERETARGGASDSTTIIQNNLDLATGFVTGKYKTVCVETVEVRAGALYAFSGRSLTDSLGVSLRDIPAAAWELLPWSFVVDWFSNVGKIISAVTASCTNEFLAEWISVRRTQEFTRQALWTTTTAPWVQIINCTDADKCIYETYTRYPTTLGQHIGLDLNFTLSRTPTLSALSLLIQQLTKGK